MGSGERQARGRIARIAEILTVARSGRSISFYLLLLLPLILLLSLHAFLDATRPGRFAFGLLCLFVFLGIALQRAIMDMLDILRDHLRGTRLAYQETLGDKDFVHHLADRVHAGRGED